MEVNRRRRNPDLQREANLRARGVTLEQYETLWRAQDGKCAICRQPETARQNGVLWRLSVDHSHGDGAIRGLLCTRCNPGLGYFRDDPKLLRLAADYLEAQWSR